jgi:hypothetical protein
VLETSTYVLDMFEWLFLCWNIQTRLQNKIAIGYTKQISKNNINSYKKNDSNALCKVNNNKYSKMIYFCQSRKMGLFMCSYWSPPYGTDKCTPHECGSSWISSTLYYE